MNKERFEGSYQSHENMLKAYLEYYRLWDSWVQKRSVRDFYKVNKAAKNLHVLMKTHHSTLRKEFYNRKSKTESDDP